MGYITRAFSALSSAASVFIYSKGDRDPGEKELGGGAAMGSALAEMGLELELCAMRTVGSFVKEASAIESGGGGRATRLEASIKSLEEEKRKIEAFRRELPLCMRLLSEGPCDASLSSSSFYHIFLGYCCDGKISSLDFDCSDRRIDKGDRSVPWREFRTCSRGIHSY